MKRSLALVASLLSLAGSAFADGTLVTSGTNNPYTLAAEAPNLSLIFARLFGPTGLTVDSIADLGDGQSHSAHFNSAFQSELAQFTVALTSKLVSVPLPSPASSVVYEYNAQGDLVRSQKSFGPLLAERIETVGAKRISYGFAFQRFAFDRVEGLDLHAVPAVFQHDDAEEGGGKLDVVSTTNDITADVNQFTAFATYGVTDRLDISLAVPYASTSLSVRSVATIHRLGSTNPAIHFFRQTDGSMGDVRVFTATGQASGIGDITVRAKGLVKRWGASGIAAGVDVRIPTGDEKNLLGAGAAGLRPFGIWSGTFGALSPHVNVGYLWNGSSPLAGSPLEGTSEPLPAHLQTVLGADLRVSGRLTVAFDALGDRIFGAPRLVPTTFVSGHTEMPNITIVESDYSEWNGAAGMKVLIARDLLLNANLLFRLNDTGLRSRVTALIGLGYSR